VEEGFQTKLSILDLQNKPVTSIILTSNQLNQARRHSRGKQGMGVGAKMGDWGLGTSNSLANLERAN